MANPLLESRAQAYAAARGLRLIKMLGFGNDGEVWSTDKKTAVKALERQRNYDAEIGCYQRLEMHNVSAIGRFLIPKLRGWDDDLLIVEMDIVSPPFILDFGKSYLDFPPDFSPEVLADEERKQVELWEDRWPQVRTIIAQLESVGIYYQDPKPGNIAFDGQFD